MVQSRRAPTIYAVLIYAWIALGFGHVPLRPQAVSFGGDIALTSDYIYRGFSETNDKAALQLDLHASSPREPFAGVWTSTLDHKYLPYADYEVEEYIGQRFDSEQRLNTSITATNYSYLGGQQYYSNGLPAGLRLGFLPRPLTFSLAAIPNAVRYAGYSYYHLAVTRRTTRKRQVSGS